MKSESREIGCYDDNMALKFGRHLGNAAAEVPVKFRIDWNKANLRDLTAATGLVILLKLDSNRRFFGPFDLEI